MRNGAESAASTCWRRSSHQPDGARSASPRLERARLRAISGASIVGSQGHNIIDEVEALCVELLKLAFRCR